MESQKPEWFFYCCRYFCSIAELYRIQTYLSEKIEGSVVGCFSFKKDIRAKFIV